MYKCFAILYISIGVVGVGISDKKSEDEVSSDKKSEDEVSSPVLGDIFVVIARCHGLLCLPAHL